MTNEERDPVDAELEELRGSKAALQAEIERLRALGPDDDWEERGAAGELRAEIERLKALLQERNEEIARLRGSNTKLESENERLRAERHTVKRMLRDLLEKHGASGA